LRRVLPRIAHRDFAQRKREALLRRIDFAHPAGDRLSDRDCRIIRLQADRKLRHMNESIESRLDFDEESEISRANDAAGERSSRREALFDIRPWIGFEIFHRERNALDRKSTRL